MWLRLLVFVGLMLAVAAGGSYLIFRWWPTEQLRQLHQANQELQTELQRLQRETDTLATLLGKADSLEKALYRGLVPGADSVKLPTAAPLPVQVVALSADTLQSYVGRVEGALAALARAERTLQLPEFRSARLPRFLPCECEALGAGFGSVRHPILDTEYPHQGIDFLVGEGALVRATGDGLVIQVERFTSEGLAKVSIQHTEGLRTLYYPLRAEVEVGQWVAAGTPLGRVGRIPFSKAPFLHYEVRVKNEAMDPLPYLWGSFSQEQIEQWRQVFAHQTYGLH